MDRGSAEWLDDIPDTAWRKAAVAIFEAEDAALMEWRAFVASKPRRMNAADAKRAAYLHGVLTGLHRAAVEFEKRRPIRVVASGVTP